MGRNPLRIAQIQGEFFSKFFAFSFFFVVVNPVSPMNKRRYLYKKKPLKMTWLLLSSFQLCLELSCRGFHYQPW